MPLDRDFLQMLTAPVVLERYSGSDLWGNDAYDPPTTEASFIDSTNAVFPTDEEGDRKGSTPSSTTTLLMDGIGIRPRDKIIYDGNVHYVTEVETAKDEFGINLFQNVTVTTTKRG